MPPPREQVNKTDDNKRILANRYRVEKKLGSGNYGTAYLVTDLKDNDELLVNLLIKKFFLVIIFVCLKESVKRSKCW